MWLESIVLAVLVGGSFVYATWTLLPQAARRSLVRHLRRWPLPRGLARRLQSAPQASGCGSCSGCERAPPSTPQAQPLRFHPRRDNPALSARATTLPNGIEQ